MPNASNIDSINKISELMQKTFLPFKRLESAVNKLAFAQPRFDNIIKKFGGTIVYEQYKYRFPDHHLNTPAYVNRVNDLINVTNKIALSNETLKSFLYPMSNDLYSISQKWLEPSIKLNEAVKNVMGNYYYNNMFTNFIPKYNNIDIMGNFVSKLKIMYNEIEDDCILVKNDGTISISDNKIDIQNIATELQEIVNEIKSYRENKNPTEYINIILDKIGYLEKPIELFFLHIFLPFLIAIFANISTHKYFESNSIKNKNEALKQIKKVVSQNIEPHLLNEYRFVTAQVLNIRSSHSQKSKVIDEISLGQVVRIKYKKRNWTLIEYNYEGSDEIFTGWVFTRYLCKFHK